MEPWTQKHTKKAIWIIIICLIIFSYWRFKPTYKTEGFNATITDKSTAMNSGGLHHFIYFVGNKQLAPNGEQTTEAGKIIVDDNTYARYSIDDTIAIRKTTKYKYGFKNKIKYTKEGE